MKVLLFFLFIGIIYVESMIYFVIPSEFIKNNNENNIRNLLIFLGIVVPYFIIWGWYVCKYTYSKYDPDEQWSKLTNIRIGIILQISWYIILSYFRYRIIFIFGCIVSIIAFILPIFTIIEIPIFKVKIFFLIVTFIQIGIILWVSIEFIIYEKIITYSWIVAYYFYPIYLVILAALFVRFLRLEEIPEIPS